jgi:hypothetical protein
VYWILHARPKSRKVFMRFKFYLKSLNAKKKSNALIRATKYINKYIFVLIKIMKLLKVTRLKRFGKSQNIRQKKAN